MTSSSGVTDARDQSLEEFCNLFWQVAGKQRQIFAGKQNCPMKNWTKAVASDLNKVKKARTLS